MDQEEKTQEVNRLPLRALGLRTGMALQTRRLVEGASKKESQYFGAIESKGVMVGPMGSDSEQTGLTEGEVCVVRGFTGQYEFSFLSKVLQTFEKPFVYALLAYPAQVDARLVRQSMRTKTSWPTQVREPGGDVEVALVDISVAGAMIKASSNLAAVGAPLKVVMDVTVDGGPMQLILDAKVCHVNKGTHEDAHFIGMAFQNLTREDKLALFYLTQTPQAIQA
jgi:c-di-GMP-binding flagellar brake protein YcgR